MKTLFKRVTRKALNLCNTIIYFFKKEKYNSKIFCIGYNKTGTTTLGRSFEILGYRNSSFNPAIWRNYYIDNNIIKILNYTAKFDSFDDLPWLKEDMIPILDKVFPNSKFIYLVRTEESWKKSFYNWRFKTFGAYPDVEKEWQNYKNHEKFVLGYFKNKPAAQFIILDVRDENGFKKLADFLGKKTNRKNFPHCNKA